MKEPPCAYSANNHRWLALPFREQLTRFYHKESSSPHPAIVPIEGTVLFELPVTMVSFFISKKQRFVAYSPIIRCLFFILWRSVRKTTIILGMKKIRIVVDNMPLKPDEGYYRNTSCTLNLISIWYSLYMYLFRNSLYMYLFRNCFFSDTPTNFTFII